MSPSRTVLTIPSFRQARVCACGDHGFVGLTQGFVALFDAHDLPLISGRNWAILRAGRRLFYARTHKGRATELMHRVIVNASDQGCKVDHFDHDTLNNRRSNLRNGTHRQNLFNQKSRGSAGTPFKGLMRRGSRFTALIMVDGKSHNLGTHATPEDAARAYDAAALRLHGEFALTNEAMGHFAQGDHA